MELIGINLGGHKNLFHQPLTSISVSYDAWIEFLQEAGVRF